MFKRLSWISNCILC